MIPNPKDIVILLDLNYTLVANSQLKQKQHGMPYAEKIKHETYRQWLVDLVSVHTVVLCTVRFAQFRQATLDNIQRLTHWQPEDAFFNHTHDWKGDSVKIRYLPDIFARYGTPDKRPYFAIESGRPAREMYGRFGIFSESVREHPWSSLPLQFNTEPF